MSAIFSKPKLPPIPKPEPLPEEPTIESTTVSAEDAERKKKALRQGRASTILTGSTGVESNGTGSTALLGG